MTFAPMQSLRQGKTARESSSWQMTLVSGDWQASVAITRCNVITKTFCRAGFLKSEPAYERVLTQVSTLLYTQVMLELI